MKHQMMTTAAAALLAFSAGTASAWEYSLQSVFWNGGGSTQFYTGEMEFDLGGRSFLQGGITAVSYSFGNFGDFMVEAHYGYELSDEVDVGAFAVYEGWTGAKWYSIGAEIKYESGATSIEGFVANSSPVGGGPSATYWGAMLDYEITANIDLIGGIYNNGYGTNRFSVGAKYHLSNDMYISASFESFTGGGSGISVEFGGTVGDEVTFAPRNWAKINF